MKQSPSSVAVDRIKGRIIALSAFFIVSIGYGSRLMAATTLATSVQDWEELQSHNMISAASSGRTRDAIRWYGASSAEMEEWRRNQTVYFIIQGMELWERDIGSLEKYAWLESALRLSSQVAKPPDEWGVRYVAMRTQFLSDTRISNRRKLALRRQELAIDLRKLLKDAQCGKHIEWSGLQARFIDFVAQSYRDVEHPKDDPAVDMISEMCDDSLIEYNVNDRTARRWFISALHSSGNPNLSGFLGAVDRVSELRLAPIDFSFITTDGREIRLADLRGKVVLVDCWSLGCEGCIRALSSVKRLYDKYRTQGLEVISVALVYGVTRADNVTKIKEVEQEKGVSWPNCFWGSAKEKDFIFRWGVTATGNNFLLDRDGKLLLQNLGVGSPRFESEVRRALGLSPDDSGISETH